MEPTEAGTDRCPLEIALSLVLLASGLFPHCLTPAYAVTRSLAFQKVRVLNVGVNLLTVNLKDPTVKVSVELAAGFPGHDEPFTTMVKRSGAEAAVTGTYFSTTSLYPIGDIVIDGRLRYFGGMGSSLALTPRNEAVFRRLPYGRHQEWEGYETVLAAGPTLVRRGKVDLTPGHERFSDPRVLGRATRAALGWKEGNKLLIVVIRQPTTLRELAKILLHLDCIDAINLDGGTSTGLYYRGAVLVRPGRRLVNILTIRSGVPSLLRFGEADEGRETRSSRLRLQLAATCFDRGEVAVRQSHLERSVEHFRKASRLSPDNASYHVALARVLGSTGRLAERSTVLAEAGNAYLQKHLKALAAEQFRQSLQVNPLDLPTRQRYAQVLEDLGDTKAAAAQRQQIVEMQLALTTPLGRLGPRRRLAEASLSPPSPKYRQLEPRLKGQFWKRVTRSGLKRGFTAKQWDFMVQLHEDWRFKQSKDMTVLTLENPRGHFTGLLKVFPCSPSASLQDFREKFHSGQFHDMESTRRYARNDAEVIEDRCRAMVAGEQMILRCVFVKRDGYLLVLNLSARRRDARRANKEFDELLRRLRFGTSVESGQAH